jgi:hypothetical protein
VKPVCKMVCNSKAQKSCMARRKKAVVVEMVEWCTHQNPLKMRVAA